MIAATHEPMPRVYKARHTKRPRRTKAVMEALRDGLIDIINEYDQMTVRQVFYQAVVRGLIPKDEKQYDTIDRLLVQMRDDGTINLDVIIDQTREIHRLWDYGSPAEAIRRILSSYKRDPWEDQPERVVIILEKAALAGIVQDVTDRYHVPLMTCKGFSSISQIQDLCDVMDEHEDASWVLFHLGDHDPSGLCIEQSIEKRLLDHDGDFTLERLAVTPAQVSQYHLPTRPTKQKDTRAKTFNGASVELDAIAPDILKDIIEQAIMQHIDQDIFAETRDREQRDIRRLKSVLGEYKDNDGHESAIDEEGVES
ncbi:MAG: hypothetical protein QUV05_04145 [Phycisphaerae bacterium]|nr:hypothetical protein [Phycisphaerae bacterium]